MGLRSRLRNGIKAVVEGIKGVSPEARNPGHPPPYVEPEGKTDQDRPVAEDKGPSGVDRPWYLDGTNEGWDETNPGEDWKKKLEGD